MGPRTYHWKLCEVVQSVATCGGANQVFQGMGLDKALWQLSFSL